MVPGYAAGALDSERSIVAERSDNISDPVLRERIVQARRGQAYFSSFVQRLTDEDFDEPSLLSGWTRRHVVAHVALNARALTHLIEWAATGVETPMYASPEQRNRDIEFTATLPVQGLRELSDQAAMHLDAAWRDLLEDRWEYPVTTAQGRTVPVSESIWMRSREVWIHSVDLRNGASFDDFPAEMLDGILRDVLGAWAARQDAEVLPRYVIEPFDRPAVRGAEADAGAAGQGEPVIVRGTAAQLAQWATGRGDAGVVTQDGGSVAAPRWL